MTKFLIRPAVLAAVLFAVPASAGTAIGWRGAGWYLWMSGTYEDGGTFREPVDGAFPDSPTCTAKRDEWIAEERKTNPNQPPRNSYSCSYHAEPWGDYGGEAS